MFWFPVRLWLLMDAVAYAIQLDWDESAHDAYMEVQCGCDSEENFRLTWSPMVYQAWVRKLKEVECLLEIKEATGVWPHGYFWASAIRVS